MLKSLANPRDKAELLRRLTLMRPDSVRRWGRMSAHQMVCHLRDAFLMGTPDKPLGDLTRQRRVLKVFALYAPLRWPAGIATSPEVDQEIGGTRPGTFEADVAALEAIVERLTAERDFFRGRRHPILGPMSQAAWMRWAYLHMDHHLRQFGV